MKDQIQIAIAEDHDLVRQGLVLLLKGHERIKVIFDVSNGQQLLDKLKTIKPHIILLDLEMPVMGGKEALEKIKQRYPNIKIIVISAFFHEPFIIEYIKKGVNSFLPKDSKIDKVIEAICTVHEQGTYFDGKVAAMLAKAVAHPEDNKESEEIDLSDQDINIIKLICQYKSSKEIADQLSLSKKTIDWHRSKIMRRTNTKNLPGLITWAVQHKIVNIL